jgi:sugar lactone lactonase YvrE
VHAQGFTTIIDLAFDHLGRLIVLQTGPDPFDATLAGALIRVAPDGQRTVLASAGLTNPGGVAVAGPGMFYLTSGLATGGDAGTLLRLRVSG